MKRVGMLAAMAVLISLLGGCSLILTQVATDFSVSVEPDQVTIAPGGEARVRVSIDRILPVDVVPTPVTVTLHNPPTGVSAKDLVIPSGIDADDLTVQVAPGTAPTGPDPVEITVRASTAIKTQEATFELIIEANEATEATE